MAIGPVGSVARFHTQTSLKIRCEEGHLFSVQTDCVNCIAAAGAKALAHLKKSVDKLV